MRKLLLILVILTGALGAWIFYERYFVQKTFGPSSMLAVGLLLFAFLFLLLTFLLYKTRHGLTMAKIWLAGVTMILTYLLVDLAAGFILIKPLSPTLVPDEYRHHKFVPDSFSKIEQRDFSYVQRVNNVGIRGADIEVEKPLDHYRILMLGDSFTMGKGVEDDETASFLLEGHLNQGDYPCNPKKIEVLNGGVDSYAPVLSYIQLARDLVRLEPDLVVLNLDVSDLIQEAAYRTEAVRGPEGGIVAVPGKADKALLNERIRDWIEQNMFLTRLALFYANKLMDHKDLTVKDVVTRANDEAVAHTLAEDTTPREEQWQNIFESIVNIRDFCASRDVEFLLTIYPWAHQVSDAEWNPGRFTFMSRDSTPTDSNLIKVRALSEEHGIELLDLFPVFRAYRGDAPLHFKYDMHWTTTGNQVMADGLQAYLKSRYSKDWCR
ncbi:MAG: hypothetical protein IFK94_15950 [Acidobacteria bacterium]|uniref:AlgX/AlgJ SGNH hydrolase-like domain-containing protein n=1 Tax=Candidatus Polarisedimenticola svalbardensis TaxID=2886004 RepID=A0A8J7CFJ7_9BACT|nr:hypothetical protein [Candidatus Polarisedimenticola svalbardensis]